METNNMEQARLCLLGDLQAKTDLIFTNIEDQGAVRPHEELPYATSNMVRIQRALSWLSRERELKQNDPDITFILHWIAFEALYGTDDEIYQQKKNHTADQIMNFVNSLEIREDDRLRLVTTVRQVWESVIHLFENQFIDPECWSRYYQGTTKAGRKHNPFAKKSEPIRKSVLKDPQQFDQFLKKMFSRLYLLRNQLFHGNASYKGGSESQRSDQINHGSKVMYQLIPVVIRIMLDALEHYPEKEGWGKIPYPRILAA